MKSGDKVVVTRPDGSILFGTISRMDVATFHGKNYHIIKSNTTGIESYIDSETITLESDTKLVIPDGYFEKEELLEIVNQEKSAEEILLDLKDHLTN